MLEMMIRLCSNSTIPYNTRKVVIIITWPWKSADFNLPENFDVAFGRMKTLLRRFQNDHTQAIS